MKRLITIGLLMVFALGTVMTSAQAGILPGLKEFDPFNKNSTAHKIFTGPSSAESSVGTTWTSSYRIRNGKVYQETHNDATGKRTAQKYLRKAQIKRDSAGRAYWVDPQRQAKNVRAASYDRKPQKSPTPSSKANKNTATTNSGGDVPRFVISLHHDENGRTYTYRQSGGKKSRLFVTRTSKPIHEAFLIDGPHWKDGREYYRYCITHTGVGAPGWAYEATNSGRYVIWFPKGGTGKVLYTPDDGNTWVPERFCPPAGWVQR